MRGSRSEQKYRVESSFPPQVKREYYSTLLPQVVDEMGLQVLNCIGMVLGLEYEDAAKLKL